MDIGGPELKMKSLLNCLEKYGIGNRPFTVDDFERICIAEDIEIFWSNKKYAFYFQDPAQDIRAIVLPKRLTGLKLLFTMLHELAHHMLHGGDEPSLAFLGKGDSKYEAEADAFALIALMPTTDPRHLECFEDSRFARALLADRERLSFCYGI